MSDSYYTENANEKTRTNLNKFVIKVQKSTYTIFFQGSYPEPEPDYLEWRVQYCLIPLPHCHSFFTQSELRLGYIFPLGV